MWALPLALGIGGVWAFVEYMRRDAAHLTPHYRLGVLRYQAQPPTKRPDVG